MYFGIYSYLDKQYKRTEIMAESEIIKTCQRFLQAAASEFAISKAFLFGSFAKGNFSDNSDIDLAIVLKNLADPFAAQLALMKLRRKFDLRIEPHPFREEDFNQSDPFVNEILKTG